MTPHAIEIIRSGLKALARDPDGFETEFYATLFKRAPNLHPVFTSDLRRDGRKLVVMLTLALNSLESRTTILGIVEALARRHGHLGIKPAHFAVVGQALLETLARRLGPDFSDDASETWRDAYVAFSETLMAAAYNPIHLAA
jgi:nitric oxide dioxygenase